MKTTLDYFNEIKCPIVRRRAIRNCDEPEKQESSLKWAIHGGFVWRETPEGVAYWSEVYENPLAPSPEHLLPDGYREEAEPNLTLAAVTDLKMEHSKQEKEIYELAELLMQSENLEASATILRDFAEKCYQEGAIDAQNDAAKEIREHYIVAGHKNR